MRGPDRRRSPPPPQMRRDERRGGPMPFPPPPPPPRGGRRGRSPSPPMDRFRRSPPAKRFRRDEPYDRFGPPPPRGYDEPPPFDRRGPPMGPPPPFDRRYDDRYDDRYRDPYGDPYRRDYPPSPPPPRRTGPMTYKELMRELPDDITPEDAQAEYQAYLARWWGSEVKAEFESRKNDEDLRRRFDPREHRKAVEQRNRTAEATARSFLEDWADGKIDPAAPDFNQGNGAAAAADASATAEAVADDKAASPTAAKASTPRSAAAEKASKAKVAPEASWQPARVTSDLALAKELASKLDAEKGIADNGLLADGSGGAAAGGASPDGTPPPQSEAAAAAKEEGEGDSLDQQVGRLDLLLTYLWRVHGVDYYGGTEVSEPEEDQRNGPRPTVRCPCPEEGEQADEVDQKEQAAIMEKGVDGVWRARLTASDPFQLPLKQEKVDRHIEEWIDSQIVKIDEKKWGSKVSQKLFVDRAYVVKHIRNKHPHLLDVERDAFYDELYFENFKEAKEEEERIAREEAEAARAAQARALAGSYDGAKGDGAAWGGDGSGAMDADGNGPPAASGGFPPDGLPAPFVGGSPAGMMAHGGGQAGGGMMNVPAGMVLVPAPGAGPLGPFIPVPMEQAGGGGMMGMGMRGGRGMGGRGMGTPGRGMGGRGMGMGMGMVMGRGGDIRRAREYVDLDDPANQRSVLDYGDL